MDTIKQQRLDVKRIVDGAGITQPLADAPNTRQVKRTLARVVPLTETGCERAA